MTIHLQAVQQWCRARAAAIGRAADRGEMIVDNFVFPVLLSALVGLVLLGSGCCDEITARFGLLVQVRLVGLAPQASR